MEKKFKITEKILSIFKQFWKGMEKNLWQNEKKKTHEKTPKQSTKLVEESNKSRLYQKFTLKRISTVVVFFLAKKSNSITQSINDQSINQSGEMKKKIHKFGNQTNFPFKYNQTKRVIFSFENFWKK